ncbi:MAG: DegT/DnrJ/EryC1/StrS family aminotransferase [Oscillospiraceae bacterium]|nr:DegT/DnrJ/EryC1/StrS family aminotransferase [Oscillospiraceae bacterium]
MNREEKEAVNALFDQVIANGGTIPYNGPEEDAYCREFAEYMGGGHADAVNSGTSAVYVALRALGVEPFSEVVVCPMTDPGGIMPVTLLNCIPVIADASPGRYNTDAYQIEKMITPLTGAIIAAHIGGEPADIKNIVKAAKKYNIPVIEDCAQSHHASLDGQLVGTFGDIAAFSTMFGKHHSTGGQGGLVFTKSEKLYWNARRAADRGKPFGLTGETNVIASLNFNSDDLACCIGRVQLKKLPDFVERRRNVAARLASLIGGLAAVSIPEQLPGAKHSYWWWRLKFNGGALTAGKELYCRALSAEGMPVAPDYGAALPQTFRWFTEKKVFGTSAYPWSAPEYKGDPDKKYPCPIAEKSVLDHFNLTINESYTDDDVRDLADIFEKVEDAFKNPA